MNDSLKINSLKKYYNVFTYHNEVKCLHTYNIILTEIKEPREYRVLFYFLLFVNIKHLVYLNNIFFLIVFSVFLICSKT